MDGTFSNLASESTAVCSSVHTHKDASANSSTADPYDKGLFTPIETLSKLSESHFTTLEHPAFPKHSVRIKQTKFCDGTVRSGPYLARPWRNTN